MSTTISGSGWEVVSSLDDLSTGQVARPQRERWGCSIAQTLSEREAVFRLIYEAYVRGGLEHPNAQEMRVTPYQLLPTTTIFTAQLTSGPESGTIFSTVSLVGDGELGLPLEEIYPNEVAERRGQGLRLAEVSCLADRRSDFKRFFPVFCALNRWMIQSARAQGFDQVLIAVHPKHARFYTRNMGFEEIGGLASYPSVRNRPAVALCFDFARNDREPFPYYDHFFGEPIPLDDLMPSPMSDREAAYFRSILDATRAEHQPLDSAEI